MRLISMTDCITDIWCLARKNRWKWEKGENERRNCKPMARFVQADLCPVESVYKTGGTRLKQLHPKAFRASFFHFRLLTSVWCESNFLTATWNYFARSRCSAARKSPSIISLSLRKCLVPRKGQTEKRPGMCRTYITNSESRKLLAT